MPASAPDAAVSMAVKADVTSALVVRFSLTAPNSDLCVRWAAHPFSTTGYPVVEAASTASNDYKTFSKRDRLGDYSLSLFTWKFHRVNCQYLAR